MDYIFPLHLAEINVQRIKCLRFCMPEHEVGCPDVEITIEYGDVTGGSPALSCNVWARIGNSSIKGFIQTVRVPKPRESEEIDSIISALNNHPNFMKQLEQFIKFMSKAE